MNRVLLLGAGFTRNWGGFLSSEVFEYLLGRQEINALPELREILWQYKDNGGFEAALSEVQTRYGMSPQETNMLNRFQDEISTMFSQMSRKFKEESNWDPSIYKKKSITYFLTKFDAIFTLNQDLFLEMKYLNDNVQLSSDGRWNGWQIPGVEPIQNPIANSEISFMQPVLNNEFKVCDKKQPYFKLHGSFNWQNATNNRLMIVGGNKENSIQSHPILKWYLKEFERYLSGTPDTRLMVIGYSFGDAHINKIILKASETNNLKMFIIDPQGVDVIKQDKEKFKPVLEGASRRGLLDIFGNDEIAHSNITEFLK